MIVPQLRARQRRLQRYWTFASSRLASRIPSGSSFLSTVRFSRTKTPQAAKSAAAPTATDAARRQIRGIGVERFYHTDQTLDRQRDDHHHEKAREYRRTLVGALTCTRRTTSSSTTVCAISSAISDTVTKPMPSIALAPRLAIGPRCPAQRRATSPPQPIQAGEGAGAKNQRNGRVDHR